jgi:sugar-specific transcriptional regulator TrmB
MENLLLKSISPQSVRVYILLLKNGPLSAAQIGKKIGILPNTAYRNLKELIRLGFVKQSSQYPAVYSAKPKSEAVGLYTNIIVQNFQEAFAMGADSKGDPLKISFIQNRKDLLKLAERDAYKSKMQINRIISGDAVPAEFTLAFKQAVDRGVKIRILVQGASKGKSEIIRSWRKMGMGVRYTPNLNTRIVTYDSLITYFASYNLKQSQEAIGVRIEYAPLAALMDEIFELRWKAGLN